MKIDKGKVEAILLNKFGLSTRRSKNIAETIAKSDVFDKTEEVEKMAETIVKDIREVSPDLDEEEYL